MTVIRLLATLVFLTLSGQVLAHKVNVFAYIEAGTVNVESYFPDGKKARLAKVTITTLDGKPVLTGQTDQNGIFKGKLTETAQTGAELLVSVDAGLGHKTTTRISVQEADPPSTGTLPSSTNRHALRAMIEQAVQKAIVPLERRLNSYERSTTAREIIGGLGYLLGLFGIIMFFQARQIASPADKKPADKPRQE